MHKSANNLKSIHNFKVCVWGGGGGVEKKKRQYPYDTGSV